MQDNFSGILSFPYAAIVPAYHTTGVESSSVCEKHTSKATFFTNSTP
jgi:hypothetical protein